MVSPHLSEKLRTILAEDYGRDVSFEEAEQILGDLTGYFDTLARLRHKSVIKKSEPPMG